MQGILPNEGVRSDAVDTPATTLVVGDPADVVHASRPGEVIAGRYIVSELIGAGGMGIVYLAHDTNLGRMVALKRARRAPSPHGSPAHSRLVDEAKTMAQLSHPCVVTVFDAGFDDGAAYVAMEYVDGVTLRSWIAVDRPTWREIAGAFAQAAHGLAAAHDAGIIHGDFKPDNVLVDRVGRARVLDFGLARAALAPSDASSGKAEGTIAYLAPERRAGQASDAASDQYAFCVSLYEALHRRKPGKGDAQPAARVPAWLRRVYERGLAADPAQRYPSMSAIATALERGGRRTGLWVGLAATTLVCAIAAGFATARAATEPTPVCQPSSKASEVWGAQNHRAVRAAFSAIGKPYADQAWATTERTLDRYAHDWAAASQDACEATHVHHTQSAELLDLRTACLDARLAELAALVGVFAEADAMVVENAAKASGALTSLAVCADVMGLKEPVPPPADPAARARIAGIRAQIAAAEALHKAGKFVEARRLAIPAATAAQQLGYRPLEAEALVRRGGVEAATADPQAADTTLTAALLAAQAGRHLRMVAKALVLRSAVVAQLGRFDEANEVVRSAFSVIEGLGSNEELLADAHHNAAFISGIRGTTDDDELDHIRRALALREKLYGPNDPRTAQTLSNLAVAQRQRGHVEEAVELQRRAITTLEQAFGPGHPAIATTLSAFGDALLDLGDFDAALVAYKRAVEIRKAALGPDHVDLSAALNGLGVVYLWRGELDLARAPLLEAIAIKERTLGPDHFKVGYTLITLGRLYVKTHESQKALAACRRSLALLEPKLGPNSIALAEAFHCLGAAELAAPQGILGAARAVPPLERSVAIFERTGSPADVAETKFKLAQALWRRKADRKRAVILAREAFDSLVATDLKGYAPVVEEIREWLDKPSTRARAPSFTAGQELARRRGRRG